MANGKSQDDIIKYYNQKIKLYKELENNFLKSLSLKARQSINELLDATNQQKQNEELNNIITQIENLVSYDSIKDLGKNAQQIQQEVAKQLLEIDKEFNVLGEDTNGLKALAEGNYEKTISAYTKNVDLLVSNKDLNDWIIKIMKRIDLIKSKNKNKKFTGYLSNLKGAYLESAIMKELYKRLPVDIQVQQTGNIKANGRQIAEDLLIVWGDGAKDSMQRVLNNQSLRSKSGRITIPVPLYREIQEGAAGISVKSGKAPIKYFEGNLDAFFDDSDEDVLAYHRNVLQRSKTKMVDNEKGRSVNKFLVAKNLQNAVGINNLFLSTRDNLLMRMSDKLRYLRDNHQLYMTNYKITNSIQGRIIE